MAPRLRRLAATLRLVHPFPSILDAAVVAAVAAAAGASLARVGLLAVSMLLLQLGIGTVNDWADAPADARAQPGKPIPSGLVGRRAAGWLGVVLVAAGLVAAAAAGPVALTVAGLGLAAGLAYDLRLKGTRWSWVPYAIGIPLLPVFAWAGATGELPATFVVLVPLAAAAGASLALANAVADLERDEAAGVETIATVLGVERARRAGAALMATTASLAVWSLLALGAASAWVAVAAAGGLLAIVGVAVGWMHGRRARQRAWELQALGAGLLATGWVAAVAEAGRLAG